MIFRPSTKKTKSYEANQAYNEAVKNLVRIKARTAETASMVRDIQEFQDTGAFFDHVLNVIVGRHV